jgi:hypothetical protein
MQNKECYLDTDSVFTMNRHIISKKFDIKYIDICKVLHYLLEALNLLFFVGKYRNSHFTDNLDGRVTWLFGGERRMHREVIPTTLI